MKPQSEMLKENKVQGIKNYFLNEGKDKNAVIELNSSPESMLLAMMCVEAIGKERVIGVIIPNGKEPNKYQSGVAAEKLGIRFLEININSTYKHILEFIDDIYVPELDRYIPIHISEETTENLSENLKTVSLLAVAQSMGGVVLRADVSDINNIIAPLSDLNSETVKSMLKLYEK